jgi:hypothetical protein
MKLNAGPLLTMIYRGTLQDTASLVGLVHSRASIGLIAFTGELTAEMKKYIETVNRWLKSKGVCEITIHPNLSRLDLKNIVDAPYRQWQWDQNECEVVLRFVGLPLPRNFKIVSNNPNQEEIKNG